MTSSTTDGQIVVVDGSNIATEGRSKPSLAQLNEAVMAFQREHPDAAVTVVVDATFGHRIAAKEVAEFDEAVANNELVAPPAGAIGRGDAFVLSIASKVEAQVLSNDSFQEFHGEHPWLFENGRLIGGKPVPNIGWVFVDRSPVKGPASRKARAEAAAPKNRKASKASKAASQPMPVPKSPPPGRAAGESTEGTGGGAAPKPRRRSKDTAPVNDLLPFLEFVEHHPIGSSVTGVVDSYSSHGAYVLVGDLRGYVPLRLMGDPPPRSARAVMTLGEAVTLVVAAFAPARRSVDLAVPEVGTEEPDAAAASEEAKQRARREAEKQQGEDDTPETQQASAKKTVAKKQRAKKTAAKKTAAKKTAAKKTAAKKTAAKQQPAKQTAAKKTAAKQQPAKQTAAKKTAAKKTAAKQTAAKQPAAKKQTAAKKQPAKQQASTRRRAARKASAT